jgi:hypothetical protein
VTQTVEVTGETPLLQPDSASLGQVIDAGMVKGIPLNGRNVYNLAALSPSAVPLSNPTIKSEAKPDDLIQWTEGRVLVAAGSPFRPASANRLPAATSRIDAGSRTAIARP